MYKISSNENPYPPLPSVLTAMRTPAPKPTANGPVRERPTA
jgi:histidinol-phosphate/aromatic aminotransferase/cobyric acid decarboxylase-like protein